MLLPPPPCFGALLRVPCHVARIVDLLPLVEAGQEVEGRGFADLLVGHDAQRAVPPTGLGREQRLGLPARGVALAFEGAGLPKRDQFDELRGKVGKRLSVRHRAVLVGEPSPFSCPSDDGLDGEALPICPRSTSMTSAGS